MADNWYLFRLSKKAISFPDNPEFSAGNNFIRLFMNGGVSPLLFFTHNALQIFSKYKCPKNKL